MPKGRRGLEVVKRGGFNWETLSARHFSVMRAVNAQLHTARDQSGLVPCRRAAKTAPRSCQPGCCLALPVRCQRLRCSCRPSQAPWFQPVSGSAAGTSCCLAGGPGRSHPVPAAAEWRVDRPNRSWVGPQPLARCAGQQHEAGGGQCVSYLSPHASGFRTAVLRGAAAAWVAGCSPSLLPPTHRPGHHRIAAHLLLNSCVPHVCCCSMCRRSLRSTPALHASR